MIFNKLTLKNFKSYEDTEIDFNRGISVVVGENGAGKSSILEAISFALFKQHTGKKIEDLVRSGSQDKGMSLSLEFSSNGKDYEVKREKGNSTLKSMLSIRNDPNEDYTILCSGDKEVSSQIESLLNMDGNLFLNAIYIRQGEIAQLIDKKSAEKKQLIGKLLGIDSLEKAWKNLLQIINVYENKNSELKGKLHSSADLENDYKTKIDTLNQLKNDGNSLEEELKEITTLKSTKADEKLKMEEDKSKYDSLVNELNNENTFIENLTNEKKSLQKQLDDITQNEEEISKLEKYVKKLPVYLEFEKSVLKIHDLKIEELDVLDDLESFKKQKAILDKELEGHDKFLTIDKSIDALKEEKSKLDGDLKVVTKLEKDKNILSHEIKQEKEDLDKFFNKTFDKVKREESPQEDLDKIENFKDLNYVISNILDSLTVKIKETDKEVLSKNQEIAALEESIKSSKKPLKELESVDNKCPLCQSDIDFDKKNDLTKLYNDTITSSEKAINDKKIDVHILNKSREDSEEKIEKFQKLFTQTSEYNHRYNELSKDINKLADIKKELESKGDVATLIEEITNSIEEETSKKNYYKQSYENYNQSKGALDIIGSDVEILQKLNQVRNNIDMQVQNIKLAIDQDSFLTSDIAEEELKIKINELKSKEEKYNQLKGHVQLKSTIESQFIAKKEDLEWRLNKIEKIKEDISTSSYDADKYDKILFSYETANNKFEELNSKLANVKGQATELISYIEDLTIKINDNKKFKKEQENINELLTLLTEIRELYSKNGVQKDLRNYSRPIIQKYTKEFFEKFNFNYSDLILDEDYNISVFGPEGESNIDMVSGGEKIAIALALRLAITQAMSKGNLETILLDEPTIHLDSFRRHELINLLKEIRILPQMILVTHENQLESAADNVIEVTKENGISKIKTSN
ncbi:AAA family ATPase [Methanobrevibacter sp. DSM 116169]|uniref:AAA family ATPase n=1 Tax=Methanobrevibacter sp. DSM 116169 TaxID=3242727 RepID=UPI0038FCB65C